MRLHYTSVLLVWAAAACGDNIRPATDANGDRDGTVADVPVDMPVMCEPNEVLCDGDDLVTCDGNGMEATRTPCDIGCTSTAMPPRCSRPVPTNLPATICVDPGGQSLVVAANTTRAFNTADANCQQVINQGANLPKICLMKFIDVTIEEGATVTATGPNVLSILATGTMTIDGIVDVSSTMAAAGPGSSLMAGLGGAPAAISAGGGGAGHETDGGVGGISALIVGGVGGAAGMMYGMPPLMPQRGGARGGNGGPQPQRTAAGGFAGGAVQLASCKSLAIGATAILDAGGGGGAGGNGSLTAAADPGGGAGGGSGGSILLEAPVVTIAGGVFANGGGGGSGGAHGVNNSPGVDGMPGQDGPRSTMPAAGGPGVIIGQVVTGKGGDGGAVGAAPEDGGQPTAQLVESSGGGGGAAGRIRINVKEGTMPDKTGAQLSPAPSEGAMAAN